MHADRIRAIDEVVAGGPFAADWDSLAAYRVPDWYVDGKFGIFVHWGPYAVPAFGSEWYPRNMYVRGSAEFDHHVATYGPHARYGYKDLVPGLTGAAFDPDAWAGLFREAGARFVVPVAEHHDGFAMYDSAVSEWTAARMGPQRDVVGDLAGSVRRLGMVFGASSHRAEHWWFMNGGMQFDSDVRDPRHADLYGPAAHRDVPPDQAFLDDWLVRCCEIVDLHRPALVYFDTFVEEPAFEPYLRRFAAFYYNRASAWGAGAVINYKNRAFPDGTAVPDVERGVSATLRSRVWQSDTAVSRTSWCHVHTHDYRTVEDLISTLVDVVAKNGVLLLNVGPRADGTVPEPEQALLRGIGEWLRAHGEAVYGTRPWLVFGEGPTVEREGHFAEGDRAPYTASDLRFTTRGDTLYVIALAPPASGRITVTSLATGLRLHPGPIDRVRLLGHPDPVPFSRDGSGLHVDLPAGATDHHPVLAITAPKGAAP